VKAKLGSVSKVVIVTGYDYPDALSAAPLAAAKGWPLLLAHGTLLPTYTSACIKRLAPTSGTLIVGDTTDVSVGVAALLPSPKRIGYTNHYNNCAALLDYAKTQGVSVAHVALVVGNNYPDALSAGAYLAQDSGLVLLADSQSLPSCMKQRLTANKATILMLDAIGSTKVVADAVANQANTALQ
jgi:putative cell wall-binding protein